MCVHVQMYSVLQKWKNEGRLLNAVAEDLNRPSEWNNLNQRTEQSDQEEESDLIWEGREKDLNQMDGHNDQNRAERQNDLHVNVGLQDAPGQQGGLDECVTISETPTFEQDHQQQQEQQPTATHRNEAASSKDLNKPPSHDGTDNDEGYLVCVLYVFTCMVCLVLPTCTCTCTCTSPSHLII